MTVSSNKCLFCGNDLIRQPYLHLLEDYLICPQSLYESGNQILYCSFNTSVIVGYDVTIFDGAFRFNMQSYQRENKTIISKFNNGHIYQTMIDSSFQISNFYNVPKYELSEFVKLINRLWQLQFLS